MSERSFITQARVRRTMADDWHSLPADAVLKRLDASPLGLDSQEAARRLSRFGANELVQTARVNPLRILLSQFLDVLVIVLIIAAIIFRGPWAPAGRERGPVRRRADHRDRR